MTSRKTGLPATRCGGRRFGQEPRATRRPGHCAASIQYGARPFSGSAYLRPGDVPSRSSTRTEISSAPNDRVTIVQDYQAPHRRGGLEKCGHRGNKAAPPRLPTTCLRPRHSWPTTRLRGVIDRGLPSAFRRVPLGVLSETVPLENVFCQAQKNGTGYLQTCKCLKSPSPLSIFRSLRLGAPCPSSPTTPTARPPREVFRRGDTNTGRESGASHVLTTVPRRYRPRRRYIGGPSPTLNPMDRRGFCGGAMSWRMASKTTPN